MKINKTFFTDNEVLFLGYSSRNKSFSTMILDTFTKNGIKVYPMNIKKSSDDSVKVYHSLDELPKIPKVAYVLLNSKNTKNVVNELGNVGVQKIIFQNKKTLNNETLLDCQKRNIEVIVACPMMILGNGFHKFHGLIAGVR